VLCAQAEGQQETTTYGLRNSTLGEPTRRETSYLSIHTIYRLAQHQPKSYTSIPLPADFRRVDSLADDEAGIHIDHYQPESYSSTTLPADFRQFDSLSDDEAELLDGRELVALRQHLHRVLALPTATTQRVS
jgi:hypothetical protein